MFRNELRAFCFCPGSQQDRSSNEALFNFEAVPGQHRIRRKRCLTIWKSLKATRLVASLPHEVCHWVCGRRRKDGCPSGKGSGCNPEACTFIGGSNPSPSTNEAELAQGPCKSLPSSSGRFDSGIPLQRIQIIKRKARIKNKMFMVYWTEVQGELEHPQSRNFDLHQMTDALQYMESLRKKQRMTGDICHVTMSSENPNSVGLPGVDVTGDDYDWKKRRI
jgi:hypothetical protein